MSLKRGVSTRLRSRSASRQPRARLWLEALEDRLAPTVSLQPVHLFALNGSLADACGGPALVSDGGTLSSSGYAFSNNQGLRLVGGLVDTSTYSVVMSMQLATVGQFYKKLIDFQQRSADIGLYAAGRTLQLYPGLPGADLLPVGQDFQVALTRSAQTGETRVYLNGVLQQDYTGYPSNVAVASANVLTFFEDDLVTRTESATGSIDGLAVYNGVLSAADVAELANGSLQAVSLAVSADHGSVTVNEGQAASNTGTWTGCGMVTLSASAGTVTENANGTWLWSFAGPDLSQTVTMTAQAGSTMTTTTFALVVNDVPPTISTGVLSQSPVNEGDTATAFGTWSDPGNDQVTLSASSGAVTQYANGTWSWSFTTTNGASQSRTVVITATDSDGLKASASFQLVVHNVSPTITALTSSNPSTAHPAADGNVSVQGAFTDPGLLDTHTATVDWGDGSAPQAAPVDQIHRTFAGSHHYTGGGIFTITATVTDSDGAAVSRTTTAVVSGVGLVNGTLYVIGADGNDHIAIDMAHERQGHKKDSPMLRVQTRFGSGHQTTAYFDPAAVARIVVFTGGGNNWVWIHQNVRINAFVVGQGGNDHFRGGGGYNVLVGGAGNDHLYGGGLGSILIGGAGKDQLYAHGGKSLLIAGSTANQNNLDDLTLALSAWVAGKTADALAALGPVTDDLARDHLHGRTGVATFIAGANDIWPGMSRPKHG